LYEIDNHKDVKGDLGLQLPNTSMSVSTTTLQLPDPEFEEIQSASVSLTRPSF